MLVKTEGLWAKTRYLFFGIVALAALVFLWYLMIIMLYRFPVGANIAENVSKEKLLSLKLGMNESEVKKILGPPLANKLITTGHYLIYGTPGLLGAGLEISLKINGDQLYGIYIEKADLGVYMCDKMKCLGMLNENVFNELPQNAVPVPGSEINGVTEKKAKVHSEGKVSNFYP